MKNARKLDYANPSALLALVVGVVIVKVLENVEGEETALLFVLVIAAGFVWFNQKNLAIFASELQTRMNVRGTA